MQPWMLTMLLCCAAAFLTGYIAAWALDKPMKCLKERCYSPVACNGFGYCRERNFENRNMTKLAEIGEPEKCRVLIPAEVPAPVEPVKIPKHDPRRKAPAEPEPA